MNGSLTWASIFKLTAFATAALLIAGLWWSFALYHRGPGGRAKGWFFVVLGLGAPWLLAMTWSLNDQAMKKPGFCGHCHTMTPFYRDLNDPKSDGLAPQHFQNHWVPENACYHCHTDYGLFSAFSAKLSGMKHIYTYYVKRQREDPKLLKPYPNASCLRCHGGGNRRYLKEGAHQDNAAEIASGETSCLECHSPIHKVDVPPPGSGGDGED